jgi:peptide deformylase
MSDVSTLSERERAEFERRQRAAQREIRVVGDSVLREHAAEIMVFDRGLRKLAKRMIGIMHDAPGIGLAATQVGVLQRLLVYDIDDDPQVLVNPVLSEFSEDVDETEEGCLSVPGLTMPITRSLRVRVRGFDGHGTLVDFVAEGVEARVIQHETDHLDGVLILDRTSRSARAEALRQLAERGGGGPVRSTGSEL